MVEQNTSSGKLADPGKPSVPSQDSSKFIEQLMKLDKKVNENDKKTSQKISNVQQGLQSQLAMIDKAIQSTSTKVSLAEKVNTKMHDEFSATIEKRLKENEKLVEKSSGGGFFSNLMCIGQERFSATANPSMRNTTTDSLVGKLDFSELVEDRVQPRKSHGNCSRRSSVSQSVKS